VHESPQLQILQVGRPARGCLGYIIASNQQAIIFDAGRHIEVYTQELADRGWSAIGVLESHLQADHLSGGVSLAQALGVDYWLHPYDGINPVDVLPATFPYRHLQEGMLFQLGDITLKVLHQPGHTLGMVNLLVDDKYLLTSDTLFLDSVGRPDLGGHASSWASLLYNSLQRILALPDETVILPAHASGTASGELECCHANLKELRKNNESLRNLADGPDAFLAHILDSLPSQPEIYDDIRRINSGLLEADERRMSELELGRNQCALEH
jgi:glyoxylase-like metal-dependent hydrolase (beta-lactamase superfamily II)